MAETHEQAEEAARKLAAVGFTQLAEVGFGIDSAHAHARFEPVGLAEMGALADRGELQVVDVREASEQTELAAGALAVPYRLLAEADLSSLDPEKPDRRRLPHRHAHAARPPRCWRAAASRTCARCSARAWAAGARATSEAAEAVAKAASRAAAKAAAKARAQEPSPGASSPSAPPPTSARRADRAAEWLIRPPPSASG